MLTNEPLEKIAAQLGFDKLLEQVVEQPVDDADDVYHYMWLRHIKEIGGEAPLLDFDTFIAKAKEWCE